MTLDRSISVVSTISNASVTPNVVDYNISQITPYVFVTAEGTARQFPMIFSNGIGCVINVANELPQIVFPPQSGIESLKYPIQDNPTFPVLSYFDIVADRIAANVATNRRTLLYCHHGRSRSVTFILAYLIKHHRLPLSTAFALVREKRQMALPNVGFWSQLRSYELQQQQRYAPVVHGNHQDSILYGQQMMYRISDGFQQMLAQAPLVNTLTNPMQWMYQRPSPQLHHRHLRRRPIPPHPYHLRYPSRIHHPRLF
jgi:hypothetical protein